MRDAAVEYFPGNVNESHARIMPYRRRQGKLSQGARGIPRVRRERSHPFPARRLGLRLGARERTKTTRARVRFSPSPSAQSRTDSSSPGPETVLQKERRCRQPVAVRKRAGPQAYPQRLLLAYRSVLIRFPKAPSKSSREDLRGRRRVLLRPRIPP